MKRWRCPECRAVHTARPHTYAAGVQYPMKLQQRVMWNKLAGRPFIPEIPRQVQQHWSRIFRQQCRQRENWISAAELKALVKRIGRTGITKRRVYRKNTSAPGPPHRPFAVTWAKPVCSLT